MTVDPTILSARLGRELPAGAGAIQLHTAAALHETPVPPRVWHVEGLIPASNVTLLSGDGGVGKSVLALQLAAATVTAKSWLGAVPRSGAVIYLTAEDDFAEMHRRLDAMSKLYERPLLPHFADLHFHSFADGETDPLLCAPCGRGDQLELTPLFHELADLSKTIQPVLVVLDPIADMFGGSEISRAQVRFLVAHLRRLAIRTGAAVLILSHPSVEGMRNGSGISGSTAWNNSVRSRLYLTRPTDLGEDNDLRLLTLKKANYAVSGREMRLHLGAMGYTKEEGAGALDQAIATDRVDRLFLELLAHFTATGRLVGASRANNYAPAVFAREERAKGTTARAFERSMSRHFDRGTIGLKEEGPPSKRRKYITLAADPRGVAS